MLKALPESSKPLVLTALLVSEVLLIFVVLPLHAAHRAPGALLIVVAGIFLIASLLVVLGSRTATLVFATSVILSETAAFIHGEQSSMLAAWLDTGGKHIAICAVSWVIVNAVVGRRSAMFCRLEAATVLYLNIALFFFTAYRFALALVPDAFSGLSSGIYQSRSALDLLYFSLATLVNIHDHDIAPVHPLVRLLAGMESLIGLIYPTALIAGLILLQWRRQARS